MVQAGSAVTKGATSQEDLRILRWMARTRGAAPGRMGVPLRGQDTRSGGSQLCPYPSHGFADPVLPGQKTTQFPNPGVEMRFVQSKSKV